MRALDWWRDRPRKYKLVIIALALYGLYGLAGYFGGSPWLRSAVVDGIAEVTGREVQLEGAVFNPYGLAVTLEDFVLLDPDGGDFVAFDRLYFDFELSSLFRWSIHFDDFELQRPRVHVTREESGGFNFDDLLALGGQASAQEAGLAEDPKILPVSVSRLALSGGEVRYRDESRGELRTMVLDELDFQVDDFSTRGDGTDGNDYALNVTSSEGGRFRWTGNLSLEPLTLDGRLALSGLALGPLAGFYEDRLRFDLLGGELDIATAYTLDLGGDAFRYSLSDGSVTLNNLRLRQPELDEDTLAVPKMTIAGIALDSAATSLEVERLALEQPSLLVRQLEEGVDLESLVVTGASQAAPGEGDSKAAPEEAQADTTQDESENNAAESPWRFRLNTLALKDAGLRYSDRTLRSPGELELQPLNLTVNGIQWGGEGDFEYQGKTRLNGAGDIQISGDGNLDPVRTDLRLQAQAVALAPLEPWIQDGARLALTSGNISTDLNASARKLGASPVITATGELSGQNIELREGGDRPLFQLDAFNLAGIDFKLGERSLGADRLDLNGLALESVVDEQGRGTMKRIRRDGEPETSDSANGDEAEPWRIRLADINVRNSQLEYADRSLEPDFSLGLFGIKVDMANFDTRGDQSARFTLNADLDRYAPLKVNGRIKPDPGQPFADLAIVLKNYEMNSLTPYTGLYLGRTVKSGQLALDTDLKVVDTKLESTTDLRARSFFLGGKVQSEQAVNAPVRLGLALLRNREGLIRLQVTASGDLADPSVGVSGLIFGAITNVLVKAATSPFSMLANLVGSENLDRIPFATGASELDDKGRERLRKLDQVLTKRPTLQMKLAGSWNQADRVALARQERIAAWGADEWPGVEVAAEDDAFRQHIRRAYSANLDQNPDSLVELADDATAEARREHKRKVAVRAFEALVEQGAAKIAEARLQKLASRRASAAKAYLLQSGGIDAGRLFLQSEPLEGQEPVVGVQVGLSAP